MRMLDVSTTISTDGGLLFQRDIDFGNLLVETPSKTVPIEYLSATHSVQDNVRDIVEVYAELDTSDLEAYRSDTDPQPVVELKHDLRYRDDGEIVVVFLSYTDAQEIDPINMRTILEIQDEIGDVLTMPLMSPITDALSPIIDGEVRFDSSPWDPYYSSVRHFLENSVDYNKPVMGVLPMIGWSRCRELMREYEAAGVQLYAVDFAGLKATSEEPFNHLKNIVADISKRPRNQEKYKESILYAVNYKRYHPVKNAESYPAEAVALITEGVDIAGGTHRHRHGGSDDIEITDTKVFNPNELAFDAVPLESLHEDWNYPTTITVDQFTEVGENRRRELRKVANAEMMNFALRKLRASINDGNARSFLKDKVGYQGTVASLAAEMVRTYDDATGPDLA